MRIAAVSDQHGDLSHSIPECDVLCIVGDIMPLYSSAEDWKQWQELSWVETKFVKWLKRQPFKQCLISWGNHDIAAIAPDTRKILTDTMESVDGVSVLDDETPHESIKGVIFSGFPYTPTIQQRNWAFSLPRGDMRNRLALDHHIHPETDVLLTHGPPLGFLDECDNGRAGCADLTHKIIDVAPRLVLCGHIHEQRGKRAWMWNTKGTQTRVINVSICDENYQARGARVQTYDLETT